MAELLAAGARPECVFAVTDVMAIGVVGAIKDAGLTPGEDIAVAGFDDVPILRDLTPRLTTVALPLEEIGEAAVALAVSDASDPRLSEPIVGEVRIRESILPGPRARVNRQSATPTNRDHLAEEAPRVMLPWNVMPSRTRASSRPAPHLRSWAADFIRPGGFSAPGGRSSSVANGSTSPTVVGRHQPCSPEDGPQDWRCVHPTQKSPAQRPATSQ